MITEVPTADELRRHMTEQLESTGSIRSAVWRAAFLNVPRHTFVPDFTLRSQGRLHEYSQGDPAWLAAAYSDVSLLTQFDQDGTATSSSTQPSLMAQMLESLGVRDGDTVLEIGAGTGYNAALLSHRLGPDHVVTVDVDPELVAAAAARLRQAGYEPTLVAGDGTAGHPERAPYDRLLATCGVGRIPDAWRQQVHAGGVVVANIGFGIARLAIAADHSAGGKFLPGLATFMTARPTPDATGTTAKRLVQPMLTWSGQTREITAPVVLDAPGAQFLASLLHPQVNDFALVDDEGRQIRCLFDPVTSSWARITMTGVMAARLDHGGPRDLWAEREPLLTQWRDAGRPGHQRYGLTVSSEGVHTLWLDEPDGVGWRLPDWRP
ncbi:methyltransferase domain-containing protein [Streptomyces violaceusniger]|uniref:Protein-L-isoaspartate O-methyltransferase n=1 Tax=Streptomyces violaceusniger (strain Tu 4113) TaxID=653045 RepID=G2NWH6_STRV4|nr:methyltransferase domain-containing protein [Streptomyces violaceusniger]AEM86861.1 protein-L-isoaspartate(D-aspartate) O-methyltransferase [Streptomyces violaceusniger Tu 4113]